MVHSQIKDYVRYNLWANRRLANMLQATASDLLSQKLENSFPSIQKTVLHLCDAETIWRNRLQGIPIKDFPSKNFPGNSSKMIANLEEGSLQFLQLVKTKTEDWFDETVAYHNFKGVEFRNTRRQMIQHCMNHSTYHRGQVVTLLRQVGQFDLVSTDYIWYLNQH